MGQAPGTLGLKTLAEAERRQRYAFAAALCADLGPVLVVGEAAPPDGLLGDAERLEPAALMADEEPRSDAGSPAPRSAGTLVCLDPVPASQAFALLARLAEHAAAGAAVIVALPEADAAAAARRVPGAAIVRQYALEVACLVPDGAPAEAAPFEPPALPPRAARLVLLLAGFPPERIAAACPAPEAAAQPVHLAYLAALSAAQTELRQANARLTATASARESAAAAAFEARTQRLRDEIEDLAAQLEDHRHRLAASEHHLGQARALITTPRHQAVERARIRVLNLPVARHALRAMWRRVARPR